MPRCLRRVLATATMCLVLASPAALAQEAEDRHDDHPTFHGGDHHFRNSLALFLGHTREHVEASDTYEGGFTFGLEYSHIVADHWRVGGLVERAAGEVRGTLLLAQAFFNPVGGLIIATGPGVEFVDAREHTGGAPGPGHRRVEHAHGGEETDARTEFVYRIGLLYEFKVERLIIAPAIDLDFVGRNEALVLGANIGYEF